MIDATDKLLEKFSGSKNTALKVEKPVVEEPVVEEPKVEKLVVETPKVEEPVETPKVEEPVVETPKVEEPVVETPKVEAGESYIGTTGKGTKREIQVTSIDDDGNVKYSYIDKNGKVKLSEKSLSREQWLKLNMQKKR